MTYNNHYVWRRIPVAHRENLQIGCQDTRLFWSATEVTCVIMWEGVGRFLFVCVFF